MLQVCGAEAELAYVQSSGMAQSQSSGVEDSRQHVPLSFWLKMSNHACVSPAAATRHAERYNQHMLPSNQESLCKVLGQQWAVDCTQSTQGKQCHALLLTAYMVMVEVCAPVPGEAQPDRSGSAPHQHGQALAPSRRCATHARTAAVPWQTPCAGCTGWLCWSGTPLRLGDQGLELFPVLPALLHMPLDRLDCALLNRQSMLQSSSR